MSMDTTQPLLKKCPISLRPAMLSPMYEHTQMAIPTHCSAKGRSPMNPTAIMMVNSGASARMVVEMESGMCAMAL